jgi:hypothetical protein
MAKAKNGFASKDGFHPSTQRFIHQRRINNSQTMAKKSVSPAGVGSGIRMINILLTAPERAYRRLEKELEKARRILQKRKSEIKGRRDEVVPSRKG